MGCSISVKVGLHPEDDVVEVYRSNKDITFSTKSKSCSTKEQKEAIKTEESYRIVDEILNQELKIEQELEKEKVKLLLLGAGGCGKSTIFKQMKMLYGVNFSERQRKNTIPIIHKNVVLFIKTLCEGVILLGLSSSLESKTEFEKIRFRNEDDTIDLYTAKCISKLWSDPAIQKVWLRRNELQITESTQYYFNRLEEIADSKYIPTPEDMLYTRVPTQGIVTEKYVMQGTLFEMYDVAGQRNQRKKWIHCFEGVTSVIFVAALTDYDLKLIEDENTNAMVESINLFEEICNNKYFEKSSMILFLNKMDLFEEKIKRIPIKATPEFSDFDGKEGDYLNSVTYFKKKFLSQNKSPATKTVYTHVTCATDTKTLQVVIRSCLDTILFSNLNNFNVSVWTQ